MLNILYFHWFLWSSCAKLRLLKMLFCISHICFHVRNKIGWIHAWFLQNFKSSFQAQFDKLWKYLCQWKFLRNQHQKFLELVQKWFQVLHGKSQWRFLIIRSTSNQRALLQELLQCLLFGFYKCYFLLHNDV